MATTISMPQLGETVTEGTILRWAIQVGDTVSEDDVLVEISTDKVDTEVPSPASGVVLEILVAEGETVPVGAELVVIGDPDGTPVSAETSRLSGSGVEVDEPVDSPDTGMETVGDEQTSGPAGQDPAEDGAGEHHPLAGAGLFLSPVVRRLAREHGIDVGKIAGTGRGGRVTRDDLLAVIEGQGSSPGTEQPDKDDQADQAGEDVQAGEGLIGAVEDGRLPGSELIAPRASASQDEPAQIEPALIEPVSQDEPALIEPASQDEPAQIEPASQDEPAQIDSEEGDVPPPPEPAAPPVVAAEPSVSVGSGADSQGQEDPSQRDAPPVTPSREGDEIRELDRLRAAIGRNMIKAKQTAAHVWTSVEVDFERVERVRQAHREQWKAEEGFSLTYLPFITKATLDALRAYPVVNSSFYLEDNKAVFHHNINLGIAVDLDQKGLIVTSIRDADDLTMRGIARAIRVLADKSRAGRLDPDDISGSTFTITNPGPFGSFMSAPIINVPNVAILSTDTITKRPAVVTTADGQDTIVIRHIGYLGLSWDHRALDGSTAVLFLRRIKENLEKWDWEQQVT